MWISIFAYFLGDNAKCHLLYKTLRWMINWYFGLLQTGRADGKACMKLQIQMWLTVGWAKRSAAQHELFKAAFKQPDGWRRWIGTEGRDCLEYRIANLYAIFEASGKLHMPQRREAILKFHLAYPKPPHISQAFKRAFGF